MPPPIVVITGGEGELASSLASEFGKAGCIVHRPGRKDLDVRCPGSVERFFDPLERIDVLVNNAGITDNLILQRLGPEDWDEIMDTNLKGAHLCSRAAAIKMMRGRSGHIINVGSYSALHPSVGQSAYAASKAGLIGLTKSYAREFGGRNIRVNCVLPGFLETRMTTGLSEEVRAAALERHVLKRFNTVEEAAAFIFFLTTTSHISGQIIQLDSRT